MRYRATDTTHDRTAGEQSKTSDGRTADATDPVARLQQEAGNQTLQRIATERRDVEEVSSPDRDGVGSPLDEAPEGSVGRPLGGEMRRQMERSFGRGFPDLRVHDGVGATFVNRVLGTDAYATPSDVVLRPDSDIARSHPGQLLLAHELAHVVQFREHDGERIEDGIAERETAPAEREARSAAIEAAAGDSVSVGESPTGPIAASVRPWWQRQVEGTIENVRSFPSDVAEFGSTVASGAESAWSTTTEAYHGTVDAAADRMVEYGPLGSIYRGMQENATSIRSGGVAIEEGIDDGQDDAADWMGERLKGGGALAPFGTELFDQVTQAGAGALQFGTSVGSNTLQAAANPVDAALGIEGMIANSYMPGAGAVRAGRKLRRGILGGKGVGTIARELLDPELRRRERQQFNMQMANAFIEPYRRSVGEDGDYMQGISRGAAELLTFWRSGITKSTKASKFGRSTSDTVPPGHQLPGRSQSSGLLPGGQQPSGLLPNRSQPAGLLQGGSQPAGLLPGGPQPAGLLPGRSQPAGLLPRGSQPAGLLPGGTQPAGLFSGGSSPAGSVPGGTPPAGFSAGVPAGLLRSGPQPAGLLPGGPSPASLLPGGSSPAGRLPSGTASGGLLSSGRQPAGLLPGSSGQSGLLPGGSNPSGLLLEGSQPAGLFPRNSRPAALPPGGSRPAATLNVLTGGRGGGPVIDLIRNGGGGGSPPVYGVPTSGGPPALLPGPEPAQAAMGARGIDASSRVDPAGLSRQALKTGTFRYQNSDIPELYDPEQEGGPESTWLEKIGSLFE